MVFRNPSDTKALPEFSCGNLPLSNVDSYRYLGLELNVNMNWEKTIRVLANSADRALGSVIAKSKSFGWFDNKIYSHLYNTLVRPILEYCSELWGHKSYNCINSVFMKTARFCTNTGKYTPNAAIIGDTGWEEPITRQNINMVRWLWKLNRMDKTRITHQVFQSSKDKNGRPTKWLKRITCILTDL